MRIVNDPGPMPRRWYAGSTRILGVVDAPTTPCEQERMFAGALKDPDLAGEVRPEGIALRFKIKACLPIEPEALRGVK